MTGDEPNDHSGLTDDSIVLRPARLYRLPVRNKASNKIPGIIPLDVTSQNHASDVTTENDSTEKLWGQHSSVEIPKIEVEKNGNDSPDGTSGNVSLDSGRTCSHADEDEDDIDLPSNVTDRKHIFMPLDIKTDDPRIYGKWLWFTNGYLDLHDYVWIQLSRLLLSGDVILLESSTVSASSGHARYQGVIKCYTRGDKGSIKRAGIAIQNIIKDDAILHYKTNQASKDSLSRSCGDRFITKYMLTVSKFYEKDKLDRWKPVEDTQEPDSVCEEHFVKSYVSRIPYPPPHIRRQSLGTECLPSQEYRTFRCFYPAYSTLKEFSEMWCLFCDATDIDHNGVTELDRMWTEGKKMCDEGVFEYTSCETQLKNDLRNSPRRAITFTVGVHCDIEKVMQSGDTLRDRTSYNLPMYLKICYVNDEGIKKVRVKYLYTEDRNLYEYVGEQWMLLKNRSRVLS